jgi:hypothetical protein
MARRRGRKIASPGDRQLVDALSLLAAVNAVDLLPNAMFNAIPIFVAGALAGLATGMSRAQSPPVQRPTAQPPPPTAGSIGHRESSFPGADPRFG